LADHKVENPEDVVKVGDEIEVKILRVDAEERKIGLSRKRVDWAEDDLSVDEGVMAEAGAGSSSGVELKGGVGSGSGPLFKAASSEEPADAAKAE
jgi:small subunit ribosomal protein S1